MRIRRLKRRKGRVLVVGLGQVRQRDGGVGVHAVRELKKIPLEEVLMIEMGHMFLEPLDQIEWADHVLAIDVMQAGGAPGTIYAYEVGGVEERGFHSSRNESVLISALRFLPKRVGPQIVVLGVEPRKIGCGFGLTPELERTIPRVLRGAREIIAHMKESGRAEADWEELDCCPSIARIFSPEVRLL
ncbi:MAG: hydrogenase maturation protease [Deltaproteobacteria bacterium]|nr:hydrogenase maturation protease [Deltaproteobacteria bacterium]